MRKTDCINYYNCLDMAARINGNMYCIKCKRYMCDPDIDRFNRDHQVRDCNYEKNCNGIPIEEAIAGYSAKGLRRQRKVDRMRELKKSGYDSYEIAEMFNISFRTVESYIFSSKSKKRLKADGNEIRRLRKEGHTPQDITALTGWCSATVYKYLAVKDV